MATENKKAIPENLFKTIVNKIKATVNQKVDKVSGKGLSTNDFTNADKNKLDSIESGAQINTITGVKGNAESSYRTGNVNLTAENIGLGNVGNYKAVSTASQSLTDGEKNQARTNIDAAQSSNTYTKSQTDALISQKVAEIVANAPDDFDTLKEISDWITAHSSSAAAMNSAIQNNTTAINTKVDKVTGKGLSSEDFTSAEKQKLAGIATGAQVNSITGVKGNSESSYRTGNVNITPANIGASPSDHTHDYLPLTGGTVNGDVTANNFKTNPLTSSANGNNRYSRITVDGIIVNVPTSWAYSAGVSFWNNDNTEKFGTIGAYGINNINYFFMGQSYQNAWLKVTSSETTAPKFVGDLVGNAYSLRGCTVGDDRSNQTSNPWNHFCTIQIAQSYANVSGAILVQDSYTNESDRFGILTYSLRTLSDKTMQYFHLKWNFAADSDLPNRVIAVATKNDTEGVIITLWYKLGGQYHGCNFVHLSNTVNRRYRDNFDHIIFYNRNNEGVPAYPSGTLIHSSIHYIANPASRVIDYNASDGHTIQIGYRGSGATYDEISLPAVYINSGDKINDTSFETFLNKMGASASVGSEITYASASELSAGKITVSGLFTNYKVILATITSSKYGTHQYVLPMPFIKARGNSGYMIKSTGQSSATTTDQINFLYVDDNSIRWFEHQNQGAATYSYASFIKLF